MKQRCSGSASDSSQRRKLRALATSGGRRASKKRALVSSPTRRSSPPRPALDLAHGLQHGPVAVLEGGIDDERARRQPFGDEDVARRHRVHRGEAHPAPGHEGEAEQHHPFEGHDLAPSGVEVRFVVLAGHKLARGPLDPLRADPGRDVRVDGRRLDELRGHDPVHPGRLDRGGRRQHEGPVPRAAVLASLRPYPDMGDVAREHRPVDLGVGRGPAGAGAGAKADLPRGDEELAVDVHPLPDAARREGELLTAPAPRGRAKAAALVVQEPPEVEVSHEVGARIGEAAVGGARRLSPVRGRFARIPRAQGGRDHQDLRDAVEFSGGEDHPADPGVDGKPGKPAAEPGHPIVRVERAELAEQAKAVRHESAVRRVDEGELVRPPEPARGHPKEDRGRGSWRRISGGGEPGAGLEVLARVEPHAYPPRPHPPAPSPRAGRRRRARPARREGAAPGCGSCSG